MSSAYSPGLHPLEVGFRQLHASQSEEQEGHIDTVRGHLPHIGSISADSAPRCFQLDRRVRWPDIPPEERPGSSSNAGAGPAHGLVQSARSLFHLEREATDQPLAQSRAQMVSLNQPLSPKDSRLMLTLDR